MYYNVFFLFITFFKKQLFSDATRHGVNSTQSNLNCSLTSILLLLPTTVQHLQFMLAVATWFNEKSPKCVGRVKNPGLVVRAALRRARWKITTHHSNCMTNICLAIPPLQNRADFRLYATNYVKRSSCLVKIFRRLNKPRKQRQSRLPLFCLLRIFYPENSRPRATSQI